MSLPLSISSLGLSLLNDALSAVSNSDTSTGVFLSPLSIYYALALALNGSDEGSVTHQQLLKILTARPEGSVADAGAISSFLTESDINRELSHATNTAPIATKGGISDSALLLLANGIFTKMSVIPKQDYSKRMSSLFQAISEQVSGPNEINAWVKKATKGEIPSLLDPGEKFDAVLVNALYFKGVWSFPFEKSDTEAAIFHAPGGDRDVLMMAKTFEKGDRVEVQSVPGAYDAVLLPYKGGNFHALAALPAPGTSLKQAMEALAVWGMNKSNVQRPLKTIIRIPKFRAESSCELSDTLKTLGVEEAFSPKANFGRLCDGPLLISKVLHKAIVDVDEEGTVASAATAMTMNRCAQLDQEPPVMIIFDRPFIFSIFHTPTSTPVFSGVVRCPLEVPKQPCLDFHSSESNEDAGRSPGRGAGGGCCGRWGI